MCIIHALQNMCTITQLLKEHSCSGACVCVCGGGGGGGGGEGGGLL